MYFIDTKIISVIENSFKILLISKILLIKDVCTILAKNY